MRRNFIRGLIALTAAAFLPSVIGLIPGVLSLYFFSRAGFAGVSKTFQAGDGLMKEIYGFFDRTETKKEQLQQLSKSLKEVRRTNKDKYIWFEKSGKDRNIIANDSFGVMNFLIPVKSQEEHELLRSAGITVKMSDDMGSDDVGASLCAVVPNAKVAEQVLEMLCPEKTYRVDREVSTTNYYVVKNCRSFDDAVKQVMKNPGSSELLGSDTVIHNTGVGLAPVVQSPQSVDLDNLKLEAGSFVVAVKETSKLKDAEVTFSHTKDMPLAEIGRLIDEQLSTDAAKEKFQWENQGKAYSSPVDSLSKQSFLSLDNSHEIPLVYSKTLSNNHLDANLVFTFETKAELDAFIKTGKTDVEPVLASDRNVYKMSCDTGSYTVSLPVTKEILMNEALSVNDHNFAVLERKYSQLGIDPRDLKVSYLLGAMKSDDALALREPSVEMKTYPSPKNGGYMVNGVSLSEYFEIDDTFSFENEQQQIAMLSDSCRIQSVDIRIDEKKNEVIIDSQIENNGIVTTKKDVLKLDDSDCHKLKENGISLSDAKYFVMQMYPEGFMSTQGMNPVENPVSLFLNPDQAPAVVPKVSEELPSEVSVMKSPKMKF